MDQPGRAEWPTSELRSQLSNDRDATLERIAALQHAFRSIVESTEFTSTDDEHDPEGTTIAFERSQTSALLASAEHHRDEIDAALDRLDRDEYGACESCRRAIGLERLLARPTARSCIACASRR